jgi:hypothetical protein
MRSRRWSSLARCLLDALSNNGETPHQLSVRCGHHQAAQVLRELERTARTQKAAATSERTQRATEQANRNAAELIEEEEREQAECRLKAQQAAAQKEVRGAELSPVCGVSDVVFLVHGCVASSELPAAAFLRRRLSAECVLCSGDGAQQKGKGKAAAGSSSGEASTSRGAGSGPSTQPSGSAGHHTTVEDAAQPALPAAEAASGSQQPAGGGKKEKERQRKERQRQRRMEEAREALQVAIEAMLDARCVNTL